MDTTVNFDPVKGMASMVGLLNHVGVDTHGIEKASISGAVDRAMGGEGEEIGNIARETLDIYDQEKTRFKPGKLDPSIPTPADANDPTRPKMDYKHLSGLRRQLAPYIPGGKIDGHDVGLEFNQINMLKDENRNIYKKALDKAIEEQQGLKEKYDNAIPRWMRGPLRAIPEVPSWVPGKRIADHLIRQQFSPLVPADDALRKASPEIIKHRDAFDQAESQHNFLLTAREEFVAFDKEVAAYKRQQKQAIRQQFSTPETTPEALRKLKAITGSDWKPNDAMHKKGEATFTLDLGNSEKAQQLADALNAEAFKNNDSDYTAKTSGFVVRGNKVVMNGRRLTEIQRAAMGSLDQQLKDVHIPNALLEINTPEETSTISLANTPMPQDSQMANPIHNNPFAKKSSDTQL